MARLTLTLALRRRFWVRPALTVLSWACLLTSIVSMHAANWLSDKGATLLARFGFEVTVA